MIATVHITILKNPSSKKEGLFTQDWVTDRQTDRVNAVYPC